MNLHEYLITRPVDERLAWFALFLFDGGLKDVFYSKEKHLSMLETILNLFFSSSAVVTDDFITSKQAFVQQVINKAAFSDFYK